MTSVKRREFMILLAGAMAAWPLAGRAQQPVKPFRIGYLSATSAPDPYIDIFRQGMGAVGYLEGRDFVLEACFAHRDYSRFPDLVEELLSAKVVLIVMAGPASRAAPFAEKSVPVVFGFSGDPVDAGIISSFARRGETLPEFRFCNSTLHPSELTCSRRRSPRSAKLRCSRTPTMPVTYQNCELLAMQLISAAWHFNTSRLGLMIVLNLPSRRSRKADATRCWRFPTH
jgi:putative tryptophan/tyrosine transport system substrate-binding protein